MSMHNLTWSDAIHATVGNCLPCFKASDSADEADSNRRPPRHLESLLAEVQDTDTEAETVSLHSNVGDSRRRQKKRRRSGRKSINLFGFDLFGKRNGAIRLPDSDEEDGVNGDERRHRRRGQRGRDSGAGSSSASLTFDSDAASLDPAVLDQLTPEQLEERARIAELEATEARARAQAEEDERRAQEQRDKEERRRKRRERKEMKRLAEALARNDNSTGEFEGFQGSGEGVGTPPAFVQGQPGYEYAYDEHGHLYQIPPQAHLPSSNAQVDTAQPPLHTPLDPDAEADDAVDLGGALYAGRKREYTSKGSSRDGDSDSRSRTSASRSEASSQPSYPYPHQHVQGSPQLPYTQEYIQQFPQGYPQPGYPQQFAQGYPYPHAHPQNIQSLQQPYMPQAPLSLPALQTLDPSSKKKKSKKSSKSKSSKSSEASSASHDSHTLQSPSIASPASGAFPALPFAREAQAPKSSTTLAKEQTPSPLNTSDSSRDLNDLDELDEFGVDPVGGDAVLIDVPAKAPASTATPNSVQSFAESQRGFPSPGLGGDRGFPSTGFGNRPRSFRDSGAFLANIGDERSSSPDLDI